MSNASDVLQKIYERLGSKCDTAIKKYRVTTDRYHEGQVDAYDMAMQIVEKYMED